METRNKAFDKLRTNGKLLIPFVVSLSNHESTYSVVPYIIWDSINNDE
jgi:hypothetical protein